MTVAPVLNILVLNGPNLNLLGTRKPEIYGTSTLSDVDALLQDRANALCITISSLQSNHEGQLIDWIHAARGTQDGIIINAGAYSHTSIAIRDALEAVALPTVEVHISDISAREEFRQKSYITDVAIGMICGKGIEGYLDALDMLYAHLGKT